MLCAVARWAIGDKVVTVKPECESTDWLPEALNNRKWNMNGVIIKHSDSHGLIFQVQYSDGKTGWFEPGELRKA